MSHVPTVLKSDRSVFDKMLPVDDNVQHKLQYFFSCYNLVIKEKKKMCKLPEQNTLNKTACLIMHFISRAFSNTTSLMTPVCMQYVGAMATRLYLS